jgi:hypothetical protein
VVVFDFGNVNDWNAVASSVFLISSNKDGRALEISGFMEANVLDLNSVPYRCLFVYSRLSIFSAIRRLSPLPVTGLQILAYARRSGPLSREGYLSCHTYCDTGPRFIRSHPKDRHQRPTVGFEPPTQGSSDL